MRTMRWGLLLGVMLLLLPVASAHATSVTVDQYIFQSGTGVNPGLLLGTVDMVAAGNTLTITLRNTSENGAFTDASAPALMLLTDIGFQMPGAVIISSGTVTVPAGQTCVNFTCPPNDISNQWNFANQSADGFNLPGVLPTDTFISSVQNGQSTPFAPGGIINGPNFGALSADETQFGASQQGVRDSIQIALNLSGPVTVADIDAGNVILSFGSPTAVSNGVPDGGTTAALLGGALVGLGFLRRKFSRN
jgi:hypothetical protein